MGTLKPVRNDDDISNRDYIPVEVGRNGSMTCCCGYELIKQDEMTYRCTGGNHVYHLEDGDMIKDKYGNMMLRLPERK